MFPVSIFRIVFAFIIFIMYSLRQWNVREYFTDRGIVPYNEATELLPEIFRPAFIWYPASDAIVVALHSIFLLSIVLLGIGFYSRVMAALALVLHLIFLHRNYAVAYGADLIVCFWLFYLCFIRSDAYLSVVSRFRLPRLFRWRPKDFSLSTVGIRLIQIQLCVIYGYTGMEKLKGGVWWEGSAVWMVMGNQQLSTIDLSFLQNFPLLVAIATYSTIIFEIYFPIMVWLRKMRPWWLTIGFFFHLGIALAMGLVFFSGVMIVGYIVFLSGDWLREKLHQPRVRA